MVHKTSVPGRRIYRRTFLRAAPGALAAPVLLRGRTLPAAEPTPPKFVLAWGKKGAGEGEFISPIGIAINAADELLVTDVHNCRVQRFSTDGKFLGAFDLPVDPIARPPKKFNQAAGIAVDAGGNVLVSFMLQHKVCVFSPAGKPLGEWGRRGTADGEFDQPAGVAVAADGSVLVADQLNRRVQRFSGQGKFLGKWGEYGKEAGRFDGMEPKNSRFGGPNFVSIDRQGRVFTTEGVLGRVQMFSLEGKPLAAWGNKSDEPGGFGSLKTGYSANSFGPIGVLADGVCRVWASSLNNRVQSFTAEGRYLTGTGVKGNEPGQFVNPHAMVTDGRGFLYVVDSGNHRVQKFAVGESR